jgi:sulfur relay protein TusB/DsrH
MILHTLNKTSSFTALNQQLSQCIAASDSVLLIEDGTLQCSQLAANYEQKSSWPSITKVIYALTEDALARGVSLDCDNIKFISYPEFVELSLAHDKVVSWY